MARIADTAVALAAALRRMGTGELAALRRGGEGPALWRLQAAHGADFKGRPEDWAAIVQALAILTEKGAPEERRPIHDPSRPWGAVLCDGGDPGWRPDPAARRPAGLSERRLALLLAARSAMRRDLTLRAARLVAALETALGVDVRGLALSLLLPDEPGLVAHPFYARLDGHAAQPETETHA